MKNSTLILLVALACGCHKDDEPKAYTSLLGNWVVRTPDNATVVSFRIDISNNEYVILSPSVKQNGGAYTKEPIDAQVLVTTATELESISFHTSDFIIRFLEITVNTGFTELTIANSTLVIGTDIRAFAQMKATRS
jgi:hypothetical protein